MAERKQGGRRKKEGDGEAPRAYTIQRKDRFYEVRDPTGELVCMTVYKCGAEEVIRRLTEKGEEQEQESDAEE